MNGIQPGDDGDFGIRVLLEGGPPGLAFDLGRHGVDDGERMKVPHHGGYEHFERVGGFALGEGGSDPIVYRWVRRTAVAE